MSETRGPQGQRHLDASGPREVVFCHQCDNEWYNDEHGLVCPRCEGEATEIISPENDPRPIPEPEIRNEDMRTLRDHNPWRNADADSDPDEDDIEQFVRHGQGNTTYFSRTYGSSDPRQRDPPLQGQRGDSANIAADFQRMVASMMGPGFQHSPTGRSGPNNLFPNPHEPEDPFDHPRPQFHTSTFHTGGVHGTRFTFTTGTARSPPNPRNAGGQPPDDITRYAVPPRRPGQRGVTVILIGSADQIQSILSSILGIMGPGAHGVDHDNARGGADGMPPGLSGLIGNLLNPANAVAGDAVYSQEALDRIISNLMEQHPTSNAPGPAAPSAIASLPKKKVDEKVLGAEGKAECSVCMDDVALGDEVVVLPCTHWFHEACATAWLSEHNTCPICRTGIGGESNSAPSSHTPRPPRPDATRQRSRSISSAVRNRNQERLDRIRDLGGSPASNFSSNNPWATSSSSQSPGPIAPELEERPRRRYQVIGDGNMADRGFAPPMPGSFDGPFPRRASGMRASSGGSGGSAGGGSYESRSRRSSTSNGSSSGGGFQGWLRRLGSGSGNNHGSGSGR